ncbi:MAG: putative glycoside hydrolase [Syntrophaceae bacterium]|nr:putative glycoside hydrolase [Syntrophaceae bacterium]
MLQKASIFFSSLANKFNRLYLNKNHTIPLKKSFLWTFQISLTILFLSIPGNTFGYTIGKVVDFFTKRPLKGAIIVSSSGQYIEQTDDNGIFCVKENGTRVAARAYGYLRTYQKLFPPLTPVPPEVKLFPFRPKALYLSFYGIGERSLRESALRLIEETELNALVVDVKGDQGMISYRTSVPLASEVGAQKKITVKDMEGLMATLKEKRIYTIARIVVFKDNLLAMKMPELAVRNHRGEIWRDRENLAWVDPFRKEVWDYNIEIAVEAALRGFDEIQFDYVRFPETTGLRFSMPNTEENRVKAISGFLAEAKRRLKPYNVFLAADIFGYVCWNLNDTFIGQRLDELIAPLDYLSPMLYPSGFQYGIPGYRLPVANPYEIVYLSLKKAQERSGLSSVRFRPWLQAFRDYAFDKRGFHGDEIRSQIRAAEAFGSHGWMLWNPCNIYSRDGLRD